MFPVIVTLGDRQFHLIETIRQIVSIFPKLFFPLFDKKFSYLLKVGSLGRQYISVVFFIESAPFQMFELYFGVSFGKRSRYKAGKCRSNRLHTQFSHSIQYLVLQFYLLLLPTVRKRAVPTIQIPHTMPWQMCRAGKKSPYILFFQSHFQPHSLGNRLARYGSQRHIDSPQSHPVDFLFPAFPIPIRSCITKGTHIQEISVLIRRSLLFQNKIGPSLRQLHMFPAPCFHRRASLS